jgi:RimJ/RimL family protein N-acetyltransferase
MSSGLLNRLGQQVGAALPEWVAPPRPGRVAMTGRLCRIEPLDPQTHADALFGAFADDTEGRNWTYLPYGPFADAAAFKAFLLQTCGGDDPLFFAIRDATGTPAGMASYLRISPAAGSIEIGHINLAPRLQRSTAATEAMVLMMRHAFDLGYRRYEWKCDALNTASRRAADRLGFTFEGIHRQAAVVKGRNRDTAWYSVLDGEWPVLARGFSTWLDEAADGLQRRPMAAVLAEARADARA